MSAARPARAGIDNRTKAALHVAKARLALSDESYRDVMERVAGVRSSRDLDAQGARRVMAEFERLGFVNAAKKRRPGRDGRPLARKAVALWIALHNLDETDSAHDRALAAFVRRVTGKERLLFCDARELNQVVEGLKAWGARVGWAGDGLDGLLREQRRRLDEAGQSVEPVEPGPLDDAARIPLANFYGETLRRLRLGHRHTSPTEGV